MTHAFHGDPPQIASPQCPAGRNGGWREVVNHLTSYIPSGCISLYFKLWFWWESMESIMTVIDSIPPIDEGIIIIYTLLIRGCICAASPRWTIRQIVPWFIWANEMDHGDI